MVRKTESPRILLALLAICFLAACQPSTGSIGAILGKHHTTGRVTLREVPPEMESSRAGLRPGDQLLLIEGKDVRRMSAEQIHQALVGPIGSKIALTLERDGRILRVDVQRGKLRK